MARVDGASLESEWEMRDAARSGKKRWALGNWDLRWKVTAVLAVPLAVAVGLGVSRITSEFTEANRLEGVAGNIEAIPAVTGLSASAATVAGSQMVSLLPGQSVVTDQDLSELDKAISTAQSAVSKLAGQPKAEAALQNMVTEAKAIQSRGKAAADPAEALGGIDRIRNDSVRIVESTVSQVSDPALDAAKLRLVDSLNTRATLVGELAAFNDVLHSTQSGIASFLTAANTERQLLNVLAHRFPDGDASIADMRAGVDNRVSLLGSPEAAAGKIPLGELKNSLTGSVDVYERVVAKATKDIDIAMDALAATANRDAWTYTAVVIATILAALLLAVFVARSMIVPLHQLRLAALRVAESDLPHEVAQLRQGARPEDVPLEPMPVRSTEEIGQLARAVDDIHGQALRLASDQAQMRRQVNDMFETLARRSKSLVDHQLTLIEAMEYDEKDPRLLENLFRLDHLAARMRRNGDNLLILAGTKQRRGKSAPVEIADVLRAAISEVEDYERVKLGATPRGSLKEPAASDLAHLFAELLDNALRASPPETDVKFTFAQAHDQGMLIEVADRGIGMPPTEMAEINRKLEQTAEPGPDTARHMGLFVVGRLAERHGLTVRLRPTFDTARDPGVTVTVHVPIGLIVAGQPISGPQPVTPTPSPAAPQRQSTSSSMQMRSITRTPGGNMMVTVDPGVSGPIPVSKPVEASDSEGGLPQRHPGNSMATGLRQDTAQSSPTLRPQPGQTSNGPQRGKLAAASLPKRNLSPGGPQRPPTPPTVSGAKPPGGIGAPPQRETPKSGDLPQRQPGANGVPNPTAGGGLPQRQPGTNGAPARDAASGLSPRDSAATGLPQRESAPGGLPQRDSAPGGLPQRDSAPGGLPQRGPAAGGLPQRQPGANGMPPRKPSSGLPPRDSAANGLTQRDAAPNGLTQRDAAPSGLPQREPGANGAPARDAASGLPQRDPSAGGLPQRGPASGGLPQRGSASGGLPQRESASGGLPQRESASGGLPQRDFASGNLPQRDPASGGLHQRDSASGGLSQRQPGGNGLPQRDPGASGAPRRDPSSGGLPQRPAATEGLPQREAPNGLPQRPSAAPSPTGLPQREPGATVMPQREVPPGVGLPQRERTVQPAASSAEQGAAPSAPATGRDPGKHSYKSNPSKTASFFQTRLQPADESGSPMDSPIFAEMMSAWLADPNPDRSQIAASFESPGDEGWQAARRASEAQAETKTAAGLPQRNPGGRLVPGAVSGTAGRAASRDPESIRSSLSRHQQGVRDGRAMREMNLTGDKGDR
ncbi:ATP-binding protein [Nocardia xishanensis]|uniref:histidine kinase n=1 Tax=Nocardia xishanensis TaxID=238964 RepID=A0ABW7WXI3_9NOCA